MPPRISSQSLAQEGRIELAIDAIAKGHFTSTRAAAQAYDVRRTTLQNRIKGMQPRRDRRSPNCKLTATEETTLVQWILSMDQRGLAPRPESVRQMADLLLQKRSNSDSNSDPNSSTKVGGKWVYNFVQRHQALKTRYNRKYDYQRAKCEDPRIIKD